MIAWTSKNSADLYNIAQWSGGYVDINEHGHLTMRCDGQIAGSSIDLVKLVDEIRKAGLSLPVLVRFMNVLRDRVNLLCDAFAEAIESQKYCGRYTLVYPIKANQKHGVVREIINHGASRVGLEAGSKPELMAVIALSHPGGVIVCNGYKDREYIRLSLLAKRLGLRVYVVIEKLSELKMLIAESRALNVTPLIGVRIRLASIGTGNWHETGGEKAKFGLSANQVLELVEYLRTVDMLQYLVLLHSHFGSQIANIRDIRNGMAEIARYFVELCALGAPIAIVDVGGGLGVDYEGTCSRRSCSINYSVEEYARNVVRALLEVCEATGLPHPDIVTESGRALTAHHAVLITNVIEVEPMANVEVLQQATHDEPMVMRDLWNTLQQLQRRHSVSVTEDYHDATYYFQEAKSLYIHGLLNLKHRARAELIYQAICQRLRTILQPSAKTHREILDELNERLVDKYFCNFSVFQSVPDAWALDQSFPIVPLMRLHEKPTRRAIIGDITCDSDGRINQYVSNEGIEASLPLHEIQVGEPYYLGIFLVGAYQEILGDMHNLFGDTDSINVEFSINGDYHLLMPKRGDSVNYVLRFADYDIEALHVAYSTMLDNAKLSNEQKLAYSKELLEGLAGYTYLE